MSALFDLHATNAPEFATTPNLTAPPSTIGERFSADYAGTNTSDRFWNMQKAQAEGYGKIIDDVHALTGERLPNPAANDATMDEIRENAGQPYPMIFQKRLDKLRAKTRELRSSMPEGGYGTEPGYLDPDMVNTRIATESRGAREAAQRLEGTGGGVGAFAGAAVGEMFNPFNILASFIPATRAPVWISEQAIGLFMRNVGREAAYQAVTQAGVESVSSAIDYASRAKIGTEPTAGEIAGNILGAGVLGGVLGGAARATVPAWLQVRRMWGAGEYVPTAVKDAAITLEGKALYGEKNPLGLPASANESALDKAVIDVALNRPADVSNIVQFPTAAAAPTPAAAGAQALPPVPDGMVRVFHGGDNATAGGERHVAATFEYARDFNEGKPVWYVDVPANSPWLKEVDTTGTNMPRQIMNSVAPEEVMAGAKLVPGTEPGAPAVAAEAAPPVPAAEAEKAVADARLQGAAAAEAAPTPAAPDIEIPPATIADQMPFRALQRLANVFEGNNNQPLQLLDFNPDVVARLEAAGFAKDGIMTARQFNDMVTAREARDTAVRTAGVQRLEKFAADLEKAPPAQQPVAPAPEPRVDKAPGESPEDKATLDQAKQLIESPDFAVPSEKRAAYNDALKQEQEARVAAGCLGGGAI